MKASLMGVEGGIDKTGARAKERQTDEIGTSLLYLLRVMMVSKTIAGEDDLNQPLPR
jgi:hypothetical protein